MSPPADIGDDDLDGDAWIEPGLDKIERSERSLLIFFGVLACFIGIALISLPLPQLHPILRVVCGLVLAVVGMYNMLLGLGLVLPPQTKSANRARLVIGERVLVGLFATTMLLGGAIVLATKGAVLFRLLLAVPAFVVGTLCVLIASGAVTPPDTTSDAYRRTMREVDDRKHGRSR